MSVMRNQVTNTFIQSISTVYSSLHLFIFFQLQIQRNRGGGGYPSCRQVRGGVRPHHRANTETQATTHTSGQ